MPFIIKDANIVEVRVVGNYSLVEITDKDGNLLESLLVPVSGVFDTYDEGKLALKQMLTEQIIRLQVELGNLADKVEKIDGIKEEMKDAN